MSARKRHQWATSLKEGIGERCARHGCGWERRQRADAQGRATSVSEYRDEDADGVWRRLNEVPPCRGAM